jgi:hypothetical protein
MNKETAAGLIILFFIIPGKSFSQDHLWEWWNRKHGWNGSQPQLSYIKRIPSRMGPNALPVPLIRDTRIGSEMFVLAGGDYHFSKNEFALNPYFHIYHPLQKEKIAIEMYTRPVEYYETDTLIRDLRFARDSSGKGYSKGDVCLAARINVWENFSWLPDFTADVMLKTTTGKNLENARHINAPAYATYGTLSKKIYKKDSVEIRNFLTAGGFFWQMYDNSQDDAFLLGYGFAVGTGRVNQNLLLAMYSGYLPQGDNPVVLRYNLAYHFRKSFFYFQYQYGIQDFIRHSMNLSWALKLNFPTRVKPQ